MSPLGDSMQCRLLSRVGGLLEVAGTLFHSGFLPLEDESTHYTLFGYCLVVSLLGVVENISRVGGLLEVASNLIIIIFPPLEDRISH